MTSRFSALLRSAADRLPVLCALLFLLAVAPAQAARINAIVSTNSAAEFAAAAQQFHADNPGVAVSARTPQQLAELEPGALRAWLGAGDLLFGVGLFGPEIEGVAATLAAVPGERFVMHSEHALVQLSRTGNDIVFADRAEATRFGRQRPGADLPAWLAEQRRAHPRQAEWIEARSYWQAGGVDNIAALLGWFAARLGADVEVAAPQMLAPLRFRQDGEPADPNQLRWQRQGLVAVLDHGRGDRAGDRELSDAICAELAARRLDCVTLLANWGDGSIAAVEWLAEGGHSQGRPRLVAIVNLQDFVVGGGEGRERVTALLQQLDVPVIKGLRLEGVTAAEWRLGAELPASKVHYQLAMPELQGSSQPLLLAAWSQTQEDPLTGLRFGHSVPLAEQVATLTRRLDRWHALQTKPNADKRVAIVYYNHPPGRHNIGADNLDVPQSLWQMLHALQRAGYATGELPASPADLLDQLQARGVNLPEQGDALAAMAQQVASLAAADYRRWFDTLPAAVQQEMVHGPLGLLHARLRQAVANRDIELAEQLLDKSVETVQHLLEGLEHPARLRALDLLAQLETRYRGLIATPDAAGWAAAQELVVALANTGIEGLRGWGEAPGRVMAHDGNLVLPGIRFGNVFIGPQPPRGWEVDEELLHANLVFPPPHQYLGFYHWLRDEFRADALIHLGRHSTYEFLPRRRAALAEDDYSALIAGDLPGIYPYIVDGVGEGIQAKRRGLAVMVDHLTPPLAATPLYDDLLQLRQLVESYEAGSDGPAREATLAEMKRVVAKAGLEEELRDSMAEPLTVRGIGYEEAEGELLAHEVGHYLTKLQERFMPMGLHVFGRDWEPAAVDLMLESMGAGAGSHREALAASPAAEMAALLRALDGGFVAPGKGNDPVRTPEALPTGRNFHALDSSLLPTRVGHRMGRELADRAREAASNDPSGDSGREALVLWASDTVRDEGTMIAFGLDLLGVEPVWNSRGIVEDVQRRPLVDGEQRRDVVFTSSGLFRDLYGDQLALLERAVLLALAGAADTIARDYPALRPALAAALAPLGPEVERGAEPLTRNRVAAFWTEDARRALAAGLAPDAAGPQAALRLFGVAPGAYGAGINRAVERSGSWEERGELATVYLRRMGHAYGADRQGEPVPELFGELLKSVKRTYLGRASNLYGLLDNNDAFDYLGGLSLAVEHQSGAVPASFVSWHADPRRIRLEPLPQALLQELRGRFLNPAWIEALMAHDYAGARTMGSEFIEYLWGWQVTNPDIVTDAVWDEVKAVYVDDRHQLGLDDFLEQGHNVHVKSNMLAVMLVAIQKGFWQADEATVAALAEQFARLVVDHGLPGSGHTSPDHPLFPWLSPQLEPALAAALTARVEAARGAPEASAPAPTVIAELTAATEPAPTDAPGEPARTDGGDESTEAESAGSASLAGLWWLLGVTAALLVTGIWRGRSGAHNARDATGPREVTHVR